MLKIADPLVNCDRALQVQEKGGTEVWGAVCTNII